MTSFNSIALIHPVRGPPQVSMRQDIAAAMPGAFPFAREFSNWEEVGVIGTELLRNLLICGARYHGPNHGPPAKHTDHPSFIVCPP